LKFGFIVVLSNSIDLMWTKTTIKPAGKHIFLRFLWRIVPVHICNHCSSMCPNFNLKVWFITTI